MVDPPSSTVAGFQKNFQIFRNLAADLGQYAFAGALVRRPHTFKVMKENLLILAVAVLALVANAQAQTSDTLVVTNSDSAITQFVGTNTISEADEGNPFAGLTLINDSEIPQPGVFNPFAINLNFGLVVLVEPGFDLTGYLNTHSNPVTLQDPIPFGSDVTSLFDIPLSQISDIVGITEVTSIENGFPPVIIGETISFGALSDGENGFVIPPLFFLGPTDFGFTGEPVHFASEANPLDVSAAFNVEGIQTGYTATFTSDVETSAVADSGMTISLFGLGLTGVAFLRRKVV